MEDHLMSKITTGQCLCGDVAYEITGNIGIFQYCHCSRCRKFTGSAHAANLMVSPNQFKWIKGETQVSHYSPPETKYFMTAFCSKCGSSLPWTSKGGKAIIIPAGTLDGHPGLEPTQNIFCNSKAEWFQSFDALPQYDELPPRKKA